MLVRVDGQLPEGVTAKDIILAIIGEIGTAGGTGYVIEYAGEAIRSLSMEGRMQFVGLAIVWSSRQRRGRLDRILMAVLAASAVQFASKPFIAHAFGGWGANPQAYLQSSYALVSQSLGTVFALAMTLVESSS